MSNNRHALRLLAALAVGWGLSLAAAAKTYCCTDKDGRRICSDTMPEQCADRAYREFGDKGIRDFEAPLTAAQRSSREADSAKKKEEERLAAEQRRRNQALLNTYGSEKDIDLLRDRAVADVEASGKQAQEKYDAAIKRKSQLERELEFYAKKPVPGALKSQIKENEVEIVAQKKLIDDKKKDIDATRARFEADYGLSGYDAATLTATLDTARYFEACVAAAGTNNAKSCANWGMGEVAARLNKDGLEIADAPVSAAQLAGVVARIADNTISHKIAKDVFEALWAGDGADADSIIAAKGLKQITDGGAIEAMVDAVLAANPKSVEEFRAGKDKAFNALVGQVMKAAKGKANPQQVNELLKKKLSA